MVSIDALRPALALGRRQAAGTGRPRRDDACGGRWPARQAPAGSISYPAAGCGRRGSTYSTSDRPAGRADWLTTDARHGCACMRAPACSELCAREHRDLPSPVASYYARGAGVGRRPAGAGHALHCTVARAAALGNSGACNAWVCGASIRVFAVRRSSGGGDVQVGSISVTNSPTRSR
jgi:hypothetical protein